MSAPLRDIFQWLTILSVKKLFLMAGVNLPLCSWITFTCVLLLVARGRRSVLLPSADTLKEGIDCNEVIPQPSLLYAEQVKWPQPLLLSLALETFYHLSHSALDTLQYLLISPSYSKVLKTAHRTWLGQRHCSVEWDNHLPWPAANALIDALQDTAGPFCLSFSYFFFQITVS